MLLNIATNAAFNMDLVPWATEGILMPKSWHGSGSKTGSNYEYIITLSELIEGIIPGGKTGMEPGHSGIAPQAMSKHIVANLKRNGPKALLMSILVPAAFKAGKSITKKPRAAVNRSLRDIGISGVKV